MSYYLGLLQLIGVHTLLGLSAYVLMLTGQLSLGQAGFFAIGGLLRGHSHRHLRAAHSSRAARGRAHRGLFRLPRRLSRPAGEGPDAGGRDHRVQRVRSPLLLQPELAGAPRRHPRGAGQHQRIPRDPLLRGERVVGMGDHHLRVDLRHPGHGRPVVDGPGRAPERCCGRWARTSSRPRARASTSPRSR